MDISLSMTYPILDIVLLVLFGIGYMIIIRACEPHGKKALKFYKRWFFLSQGVALLIVLFMMTTERNQIPVIGYVVLLMASCLSGTFMVGGLSIVPEERAPRTKKLLKINYWVFGSVMFLTILWAIIWWKDIFSWH